MGTTTLRAVMRGTVRLATVRLVVVRSTTLRGNGLRSTDGSTTIRADVVLEAGVLAVGGWGSAESSGLLPSVGVRSSGVQDRVSAR